MDATVANEGELRQHLDELNKAIRAALTGSSYSIGGRTLTRVDLPTLRNERTRVIRDLRTLEAVNKGAESPAEATATWYRSAPSTWHR